METFYVLLMLTLTNGFYWIPSRAPYNWLTHIVAPETNEELAKALCSSFDSQGFCTDEELKIVMVTKVFNFTGWEGTTTEEGCYRISSPECIRRGQKMLNRFNQCDGLEKTFVTYDNAGVMGLKIGSNKYVMSRGGGLIGKGLAVFNSDNVFIYGLSITDINPDLVWGGDAIWLDNATNIWIHGNYISRVGRQMIVTGFKSCQNVTISYNEFDGRTPYSAYCDGYHFWLWLFLGSDDTITLYQNYVHHISGRGPHVAGMGNAKVLLHIISNRFENINHQGLVEAYDSTARILIEGNSYVNVSRIVRLNLGKIFYPFTKNDAALCKDYIGRNCLMNTVVNSGGLNFQSDVSVLKELADYTLINTNLINKYEKAFSVYKNKDDHYSYYGDKSHNKKETLSC